MAVGLALVLTGCGTNLTLPPAQIPIAQQEIVLYALTNTPVNTPSGYNQIALREVRTDLTTDFDFVFDLRFDSAYGLGHPGDTVAVLVPRGALGFAADPGLMQATVPPPWESHLIVPATSSAYTKDKAVRIRSGDVLYSTSRRQTCQIGFVLPYYAKLLIEAIDIVNHTATIRVVADPNCGFRQVGSGIPSQ